MMNNAAVENADEVSSDDEEIASSTDDEGGGKKTASDAKHAKRRHVDPGLCRDMYKAFDGSALMAIGALYWHLHRNFI